ncbi:alpha/beta hydrolase [Pararhodospirillum photometricum]|nr:alpha/beta hydrolase [Pararhodospirillum photometricum]
MRRGQSRCCGVLKGLLLVLVVGGLLGGGVFWAGDALFRGNADFRRWYNVLRAEPYRYEGIRPVYRETDPASLIRFAGPEDMVPRRAALAEVIFGPGVTTPPADLRPDRVERGVDPQGVAALAPYRDDRVASIDRLSLTVDEGFTARFYVLHPRHPRGPVLLYQQGNAATIANAASLLGPLLERGVTIVAFNYPGYGENVLTRRSYPGYGVFEPSLREHMALDPLPLRRFFLPLLAGLNHGLAETGALVADMAGISAGGWATVVFAAVESRVRRSYPMAGAYPLYLQQQDDHPPSEEQYYRPLLQAANYLELFVMGAVGEGRAQIQFFGQYDRCCQNNRLSELYAPAVRDAAQRLGGRFDVHLNTTSPDHRINDDYVARILADLEDQGPPPAPGE